MKIKEKVAKIKSKELKAEKNISDFLERIKKENKKINSVLFVNSDAVKEAKEIDRKISLGEKVGKLAGIGVLVKSNICVKGMEVNCASKTLEGWKAPYDASVISYIRAEGGVILGMTNMDEFACGGSGETSAFGPCENPSAMGKIPGGSSSGSAVSVAKGFCDFALGSDTGGSIRNPASHCGVVGVKPSYGRVSRYGLIDLAMSFDQIGPLTKNVEDSAYVLDVLSRRDEKDSVSFDSEKIAIKKIKDLKIGVMESVSTENVQELVDSKISQVVDKYKWETEKVNIKNVDLAIQTYYPIVYVEFFSGTRKFDGRRFGKKIEDSCGEEVLRRILGGEEISKAEYGGRYYKKALEVKSVIKKEFEKAFEKVDCIVIPTVPRLPHNIGENISTEEMYSYDVLTTLANLAGICAVSVPAGKIEGVPVGLQVLCGHMEDGKMLSVAKMFEDLNGVSKR